jgi:hypothetical protein
MDMNHANIKPCCAELQQNRTLGMYTRKPVITICTQRRRKALAGSLKVLLEGSGVLRVSTEFRRHGIPSVFLTSVYSVFRAELAKIPAEFRRIP